MRFSVNRFHRVRGSPLNKACQEALEAAFPNNTDDEILRVVQQGILLADDALKSTPFLNTLVGRDLRGLVRRAAIMWRMNESCLAGDLPFRAEMMKMEKGNLHHLQLWAGDFKAHVVRTDSVLAFPEQAGSRQDERLTSAQDLFDEKVVPMSALLASLTNRYAWLTFGADRGGRLLHACWAMPAREADEWLGHIDVMRRSGMSDGAITTPTTEPPSEKIKLRFKDHIQEALDEANDNEDEQTS
jgi:hypothetical protein